MVAAVLVTVGLPAAAEDHTVTCADLDPFFGPLVDVDADLAVMWPEQRFTASVYDTRTECSYDLRPDVRITTASVLKIEIMAGVLLRAQDAGRAVTASEDALMVPMITESADPPATSLWLSLGGQSGMSALDDRLGLTDTVASTPWGGTSTSAADQVWLVRQVLLGDGGLISTDSNGQARSYLEGVIPSQQWGITAGLPDGWTHPMKNGFFPLTGRGWRINSVGFIDDPFGGGYAVAILSDGWATEAAGIEAVEFIAEAVNASLAQEGLVLVWDGTFRDDDGNVHEEAIESLVEAGITAGCNAEGDRFCPSDPVTRGQMASFLGRALGWDPLEPATFSDVGASPHAGTIEALAQAGVTAGCSTDGDLYCPDEPVTRGQMASFLVRALDWDPIEPASFVDLGDTVHAGAIEALASAGVTFGCVPEGDEYCPEEPVTRAQMASFLARAFDL